VIIAVDDEDRGASEEAEGDRIKRLLALNGATRKSAARALTFVREWNSFSHPVALSCDDGNIYVVKGKQVGRAIVNEQVVALLGVSIGAPVGEPALIDIPLELIEIEPRLAFLAAGIAHGNVYVPDCSERAWIDHQSDLGNRPRFALLAVLYGWALAGDHQLIYPNSPPHLVLSVDHGHFFPGGPEWTRTVLDNWPPAVLSQEIVSVCGLTSAELDIALASLEEVTEAMIISAVSVPPEDWGIEDEDRLTLVRYLSRRQRDLLALKTPNEVTHGK
jgi:hypothetical protein